MFRFDLLNCSLRRNPVGVLYKANERPPARLEAAINAIDLVAGRSLSMMTLELETRFFLARRVFVEGVLLVDRKRLIGLVTMRDCIQMMFLNWRRRTERSWK